MLRLLINIFILVILLSGVLLLSQHAYPIRSVVQSAKTAVAGVNTSQEVPNTLTQDLQEDLSSHVESVKEDVLSLSVSDMFSFFTRAGKIIDDIHTLQNNIKDQVFGEEETHE